MIWFKRFLPIIVIAAIWFGYNKFSDYWVQKESSDLHRTALTVAEVWVASATNRKDSLSFLRVRDSILSNSGLTPEYLLNIPDQKRDDPFWYESFAKEITRLVDSLYKIEDSLRIIRRDSLSEDREDSAVDSAVND